MHSTNLLNAGTAKGCRVKQSIDFSGLREYIKCIFNTCCSVYLESFFFLTQSNNLLEKCPILPLLFIPDATRGTVPSLGMSI